ncbi:hypothetical protein CN918_32690 [Priestia megaterium]|nr:hypothetical protein CN918_32690 [Priestia megaterium]
MKYIDSFNGWFGEIANDATYDSIAAVLDPLSQYYKKYSSPGQKLVIGYDTRYFSKEFAVFSACYMAKKGIKVFLSNCAAPSSVSIVSSLHKKSLGTLVITGDEYNAKYIGVRAYNMQGYTISSNELSSFPVSSSAASPLTLGEYMKKGIIELFDMSIIYELFVHKKISVNEMHPSINQILFNPFYGAGMYYFDYIFQSPKTQHISGMTIYNRRVSDFNFEEPNPELHYSYMFRDMQEDNVELGFVVSPDCTHFEFLVGKERLTKHEIIGILTELFQETSSDIRILSTDDIANDFFMNNSQSVNVTVTSQKEFQTHLKEGSYHLAIDSYDRIYFDNHGAPDALLCGFYLFYYFNRIERISEKASSHLQKIRNK